MRNSNAMDIDMDNGKMLTFNIVGGIIDLQFFIGDIFPETAIREYHDYLGGWSLHPFWSMGFHQSRWGYSNLEKLSDVINNFRALDLPLDTIWSDIDYMIKKEDFTVNRVDFPIYAFRDLLKSTEFRSSMLELKYLEKRMKKEKKEIFSLKISWEAI